MVLPAAGPQQAVGSRGGCWVPPQLQGPEARYKRLRGPGLLRAWDTQSIPVPCSRRGASCPRPARLSTWSGNRGTGQQPLGQPIQGHGAGHTARLGWGWAWCPGNELKAQLPSGAPPWGQPLLANHTPTAPLYNPGAAGSAPGSAFPPGQRQPLPSRPAR